MKNNFGFIASIIDGTEYKFQTREMKLPDKYSYLKYLPNVLNQGQRPICVPCSISTFLNWNKNLNTGKNHTDIKVDYEEIFKNRTNESDDGMAFKDAFHYLRHHGVKTDIGIAKIDRYFKIGSVVQLKQALIVNGPCVGGLPVYDTNRDDFWVKYKGDEYVGGHAISIIGYNEKGFIIRNSWGERYGDKGYAILPYDDFANFREIWSIV